MADRIRLHRDLEKKILLSNKNSSEDLVLDFRAISRFFTSRQNHYYNNMFRSTKYSRKLECFSCNAPSCSFEPIYLEWRLFMRFKQVFSVFSAFKQNYASVPSIFSSTLRNTIVKTATRASRAKVRPESAVDCLGPGTTSS